MGTMHAILLTMAALLSDSAGNSQATFEARFRGQGFKEPLVTGVIRLEVREQAGKAVVVGGQVIADSGVVYSVTPVAAGQSVPLNGSIYFNLVDPTGEWRGGGNVDPRTGKGRFRIFFFGLADFDAVRTKKMD